MNEKEKRYLENETVQERARKLPEGQLGFSAAQVRSLDGNQGLGHNLIVRRYLNIRIPSKCPLMATGTG